MRGSVCRNGHPRTPENTRESISKFTGLVTRRCLICARRSSRACYRRKIAGDVPSEFLDLVVDLHQAVRDRHKKTCGRGHSWTAANTGMKRGSRFCKQCHCMAETRRRERNGQQVMKTHCRNGHRRTPDNTGTSANGGRVCLVCKRAADAKKSAAWRDGKRRDTHCNRGHKRTAVNTTFRGNGHRRCLTCRALSAERSKARLAGSLKGSERQSRTGGAIVGSLEGSGQNSVDSAQITGTNSRPGFTSGHRT